MSVWFFYALAAAVLYGGHQIFTKLAAEKISDGLGGFVVEATAALAAAVGSRGDEASFGEAGQPLGAVGRFLWIR